MHLAYLLPTLVAVTNAVPYPSPVNDLTKRQVIDFTQINAATLPKAVSAPIFGTSQTVDIQPVSAAVGIANAAVASSLDTKRSLNVGEQEKRSHPIFKRDGDCSVQPAGTGPTINE